MKVIRYAAAVIIAVFAIMPLAGCGGEPVKPSAENVKATAALGVLEQMRAAYVARDMQGVLDHVSSAVDGGYSVFSSRMRKDVENYPGVELKLFIERVELKGETSEVVFHWHGNWRDNDGHNVEGRGNSVFLFTGETEIKLIKVIGDQPFGIVW